MSSTASLPQHLPLLMPDERRLVDALSQDEHAPRRQRDATVAAGSQEPADDVGSGAGLNHNPCPGVM